jgi:hypothetical protein
MRVVTHGRIFFGRDRTCLDTVLQLTLGSQVPSQSESARAFVPTRQAGPGKRVALERGLQITAGVAS